MPDAPALGIWLLVADSTDIHPQHIQVVYKEPEARQKPKVKRTKQVDMDPSNSKSADTLPSWICEVFNDTLIPSLVDYYGAQEDPWMLDPRKPTKGNPIHASGIVSDPDEPVGIVDVLQNYINQLFPRKHYSLSSNDPIVKIVSSSLMFVHEMVLTSLSGTPTSFKLAS